MEDSGYIKGYKISDESDIEELVDILIDLKNNANDGMLYAVGDGNHSLASVKDVYEKTGRGRYALVELVNIHDDGLAFFPIHRLLIHVDQNDFVKKTSNKHLPVFSILCLLQPEQLTVYLVRKAVKPVILAIQEQLDEHSLRAVPVTTLRRVWCPAHSVPYIETHSVTHPYPVSGHRIKNPAVIRPDAEKARIQILTRIVHELHGKRLLRKNQRTGTTISYHASPTE